MVPATMPVVEATGGTAGAVLAAIGEAAESEAAPQTPMPAEAVAAGPAPVAVAVSQACQE